MVNGCTCSTVGAPDTVRLCEDHHRYWKGDKRLTSVSSVIRETIPTDYSMVDPAVLENARDRGIVADSLFSAYVIGGLDRIPAGTRQDAVELFFKARRWWDGRKHGEVRSQVTLADSEIAGTCDVTDDDTIYDLKCTSEIAATYPIQLAAYAELHFATFGRPAKSLAIIHVTKRYAEPKIVKVDMVRAATDWMTMRQFYNMKQRLGFTIEFRGAVRKDVLQFHGNL